MRLPYVVLEAVLENIFSGIERGGSGWVVLAAGHEGPHLLPLPFLRRKD